MGIAFTKMHGLGNDFVVIDGVQARVELAADEVRRVADRRTGVGCDQVLVIEPARDGADFGYRIFNADGGEVEQCGNGARCVARFVREHGLSTADEVRFATRGGTIRTRQLADGRVAVDMGVPRFDPASIPFVADGEADRYELDVDGRVWRLGAVSMGNPHAVLMVDDVEQAPVTTLGPAIEHHPRFPQRANVGFVQAGDRRHIRLRVWERGVGETMACGTGACAAVAVGRRQGLLDESVTVDLAGGALVIDWAGGDNPLWMTGPATTVFEGTLAA
ncbi:MAG: diaminopimelate epimerase [Deinococcus-Thermus bacterium]|jgi:diaminopimelate epimerase|nr:diaminopimelate epimerase [Deinococcota bacterium]